ncbi:Hsp70 family protein [Streptomyces sp. NPDC000345]|uniref:Hsp70 family protein n=1 Tax=Streptomyces sp. NPDC000345 TaxID=3364537 RepID=UPI0036899335
MGDGVIEVKATCGDARLGGDDWDSETARHLAARFRSLHGVDLQPPRRPCGDCARPPKRPRSNCPRPQRPRSR